MRLRTFHKGSNTQVFILVAVMIISSVVYVSFKHSTTATANPVSLDRITVIPGTSTLNGNGTTQAPVFSEDGNYVVFQSNSTNLLSNDANTTSEDIFIYSFSTNTIELVSVDSNEVQGDGPSYSPAVSSDGRYVVFYSGATNLVAGDTNSANDIFLRDRTLGTTERISISTAGVEANSSSSSPSVSSDGRYVVFNSDSTNLVGGDTNGLLDVFIRDRQLNTTERVSVSDSEAQSTGGQSFIQGAKSISADGRYVAFYSEATNLVTGDTNALSDVFVRDLQLGTTERISVSSAEAQASGGHSGGTVSMSSDGRYVVFYSGATNLVAGDTNAPYYDTFLRDRTLGTTERISLTDLEAQGNSNSYYGDISSDGRYIVFRSEASNLVSGDTVGTDDLFIRDRQLGTTALISQSTAGAQFPATYNYFSLSSDARYVVFDSTAIGMVSGDDNNENADIFIRDRELATTEFLYTFVGIQETNFTSQRPMMSDDERYIVFESDATNLVAGDTNNATDIFLFDRTERTFERISVTSDGIQASSNSSNPYISGNGRYVVFYSESTDLVSGDTNGVGDIFLRDLFLDTTEIVSLTHVGGLADNLSMEPSVSDDGRYVLFRSFATNLITGDTNGVWDIFIRDRETDATERVSVSSDGTQASEQSLRPRFSSDGRYVVFTSEATNLVPEDTDDDEDIYIRDRTNGTTKIVSYVRNVMVHGNSDNSHPDFDAGQNFVFQSLSSDLVSGDTNNVDDIFFMNQATNQIQRVSVSTNGEEGNALSIRPKISADGRYVSYTSYATNLVAGDTNSATDIFVYDRESNITERVSISTDGTEANNASNYQDISSTGQYVVFDSNATNLVASDANFGLQDIFIRDLNADTTELVSVSTGGVQGDGASSEAVFSSNDQYVAFSSLATNLVAGDTNGVSDIFLRDLNNNTTEIVSLDSNENISTGIGAYNPSLSSDGRYVVFSSLASDFVSGDTNAAEDIFIRDRQEGTTVRINTTIDGLEPNGVSFLPEITPDGRYIIFYSYATNFVAGDTNATSDIFVFDRTTNQITRMDQSTQGVQDTYDDADEGNGFAISNDGRYVLFPSEESATLTLGYNRGLRELLIRDRELQTLTHAINFSGGFKGSTTSGFSTISKNGQYIAFHTEANNLFPNDQNDMTDVILYDNNTQTLEVVSVSSSEVLGNESSYMQETSGRSISDDGRYVAFYSYAPLVSDDTNATSDIYVRDRQEGTTVRASTSVLGVEQSSDDYDDGQGYFLSGDSRYLVYSSGGTTLVSNDQNNVSDIFFATLSNTNTTSGGGGGGVVFQPASGGGLSYVPPALLPNKEVDPSKENPELIQEKPNTPNISICNEQSKFTQYVRKGAFGGDVKKIQEFLNERGYLKVAPTGYFGVLTEQAVKAFQLDNRQVTLDPWGFKSPTGWWYHTTRGLANKIIGCPEENVTLPNGIKVSL